MSIPVGSARGLWLVAVLCGWLEGLIASVRAAEEDPSWVSPWEVLALYHERYRAAYDRPDTWPSPGEPAARVDNPDLTNYLLHRIYGIAYGTMLPPTATPLRVCYMTGTQMDGVPASEFSQHTLAGGRPVDIAAIVALGDADRMPILRDALLEMRYLCKPAARIAVEEQRLTVSIGGPGWPNPPVPWAQFASQAQTRPWIPTTTGAQMVCESTPVGADCRTVRCRYVVDQTDAPGPAYYHIYLATQSYQPDGKIHDDTERPDLVRPVAADGNYHLIDHGVLTATDLSAALQGVMVPGTSFDANQRGFILEMPRPQYPQGRAVPGTSANYPVIGSAAVPHHDYPGQSPQIPFAIIAVDFEQRPLNECPCPTCGPGNVEVKVSSFDLRIGMGESEQGRYSAVLQSRAEKYEDSLFDPRYLILPAASRGYVATRGAGGELLDVQGPYAWALFSSLGAGRTGYEVEVRQPQPGGPAFSRIEVEKPATPPRSVSVAVVSDPEGAARTQRWLYTYDAAGERWSMQATQSGSEPPASADTEEVRRATTAGPGGPLHYELRTRFRRSEGAGGNVLLARTLQIAQDFPWGRETVQEIEDPGDSAVSVFAGEPLRGAAAAHLVTAREYCTGSGNPCQNGQLLKVVRPGGAWEKYEYDDLRRPVRIARGYGDAADAPGGDCEITAFSYAAAPGAWSSTTITVRSSGVEALVTRRFTRRTSDPAAGTFTEEEAVAVDPAAGPGSAANIVSRATRWSFTAPGGAGVPFKIAGRFKNRRSPEGVLTTYAYSWEGSDPYRAPRLTTITESGAEAGGVVVSGTRKTTVIDARGVTLVERSEDFGDGADIATEERTVNNPATDIDADGRVTKYTYSDGTTEEMTYGCCGLESMRDRQGLVITHRAPVIEAPAKGPWQQVTESERGGVTTTEVDTGLTRYSRRRAGAGPALTLHAMVSDPSGLVTTDTDAMNRTTTTATAYVPVNGAMHRLQTTTTPDGAQRITESWMDGRLSRTYGSGARPERQEESFGPLPPRPGLPAPLRRDSAMEGCRIHRTIRQRMDGASVADTGEWTSTYIDMAGRTLATMAAGESKASPRRTDFFYESAGTRLIATVDPDGVITLFGFDGRGRRTVQCVDVNRNGSIDSAGRDRITLTRYATEMTAGTGFRVVTTEVYAQDDSGVPVVTRVEKTAVHDRLSVSIDHDGRVTTRETLPVGGAWNGSWTETQRTSDGTSTVDTWTGGRLLSTEQRSAGGTLLHSLVHEYDEHGRNIRRIDSRNGTTSTVYDDDDRIRTVTTPDPDGAGPLLPETTSYQYIENSAEGRAEVTTLPGNRTLVRTFLATGELASLSGTAGPRTTYTYDDTGRRQTLTTFRSAKGSGDLTAWEYHPATGRLKSKTDAAGRATHYTWSPGGRPVSETNARGQTAWFYYDGATAPGVVTGAGDLTGVAFTGPGQTPAVGYAYDRRGRRVAALRDGITRRLTLSPDGRIDAETWSGGPLDGMVTVLSYDAQGRRSYLQYGLAGNAALSGTLAYAYDADTGRLARISHGPHAALYRYIPQSGLTGGITFEAHGVPRFDEARAYDALDRLTGRGATATAYEARGWRGTVTLPDTTAWHYEYDNRGALTNADRRTGVSPTSAALPGQSYHWLWDHAGNRLTTTQGGGGVNPLTTAWQANALNQYNHIAFPAAAMSTGTAAAGAAVTINGSPASRAGTWWAWPVQASTAAGPPAARWVDIRAKAVTNQGGKPVTDERSVRTLIPPAAVTPGYDADGNLIGDGQRTFTWDAQNRLVRVETRDDARPPGAPRLRVTFRYDDLGRRIAQHVEARRPLPEDGSPPSSAHSLWMTVQHRVFLYDGWNCMAEFDYAPASGTHPARHTLFRSAAWGPDLSGTPDQAGGAGALLLINLHKAGGSTETHFPAYDPNGNVIALHPAAGPTAPSAVYDYDPFGNLLRSEGPAAPLNPWRFSTHYTDDVTGLVYYGFRYYLPAWGRWLNRDPIAEEGGSNLYAFVANNPVCSIDVHGLYQRDVHGFFTYFACLAAGASPKDASTVAYYAWGPDATDTLNALDSMYAASGGDIMKDMNSLAVLAVWDHPEPVYMVQANLHALSGENPRAYRIRHRGKLGIVLRNPRLFGIWTHTFQDTYSHTRMSDPSELYSPPFGHGRRWTLPDLVFTRPSYFYDMAGQYYSAASAVFGGTMPKDKFMRYVSAIIDAHHGHTREHFIRYIVQCRVKLESYEALLKKYGLERTELDPDAMAFGLPDDGQMENLADLDHHLNDYVD